MSRWVPTQATFHDDPHEGKTTPWGDYGGPAVFEESICQACEELVGPYLVEDYDTGRASGGFRPYLAVSYARGTETKVEMWCEDCTEPALDVLEMLDAAVR